jgi:hypothetical protein
MIVADYISFGYGTKYTSARRGVEGVNKPANDDRTQTQQGSCALRPRDFEWAPLLTPVWLT